MTYPTRPFRVLVFSVALALASAVAHSATVSGKLVHRDNSPAAGVTVTLSNDQGRSAPMQSGSDGGYVLQNIPAGRYYLEVWVNPRSPQSQPVAVSEPSTNMPQVTVP